MSYHVWVNCKSHDEEHFIGHPMYTISVQTYPHRHQKWNTNTYKSTYPIHARYFENSARSM